MEHFINNVVPHFGLLRTFRLTLLLSFSAFFLVSALSEAEAARFRPKRKSQEYKVNFQSQDPKSFYRSLSFMLERQAPDALSTLNAKAAMAELLFQTENYRQAAQIYLKLTEAPLADLYRLSSYQYRLAECYFHMGLYGNANDQFSLVRREGHPALEAESILGMAMAAVAQGNRTSAQAHLDILLLKNEYYKTYPRALYPSGIMLFQNEQYERSLDFFEKNLDDAKNIYFAGIAYRRLGNLAKALQYFQRLTQKFPGTVWAQRGSFEVAESYYQQKDDQLASRSLKRWTREYPNGTLSREVDFRLACSDFRLGNYQAVLDRLEPMLKQDMRPSLEEKVKHLTTESLVQLNQIPTLVANLKKKKRSRDRTPDENYRLIWSLAALEKYEDSLVLSEEGLNAFYDPELTPKILLVQGYSHDKQGRRAEALAAFQTIVDRFPRSAYAAQALHLMALSYVKANRWQELVTHVNHHWLELPNDIRLKYPDVEFWITEGQLSLGNFEIAEKRYQKFLSVASNHKLAPYAYLGLAVAKAGNKKLDEGFETLLQFASIAREKKEEEWIRMATLQSGNLYYNQKNYTQAIGAYRKFQTDYKDDPRVPQTMFLEAQALYRLEYYTDAVAAWKKLAKEFPENEYTEQSRFQVARTLFDLGETTAAVKAYQTFIVKHPASPRIKEARLQLAHNYYNAGDYAKAIPKYEEFLAIYPNSDEAVSVQEFLQMSYVQVGKSDAEIDVLTQGQAKAQVLVDLYWEKGAKAYNEKDYESALGYFEKVLIDFPASSLAAQAGYYRAESLYLLERYDQATAAYRNFLIQFPSDEQAPTASFRLGVALFNQNRFDEAAKAFEDLVAKYPNDPMAANAAENIPLAYAKLGATDKAMEAYEKLLSQVTDPARRASLLLQIAQTKEKKGQAGEAIKFYKQISPTAKEYLEAIYSVGIIYSQAGQTDQEIATYELLLKASPKNDPFRIAGISRMAELLISQGKAKRALSIYSDVASNSSDQTALANAQTRLEELKKVLNQ